MKKSRKQSPRSDETLLESLYDEYVRNTDAFLEVSRKISKTEDENEYKLLRKRELQLMKESQALVSKIIALDP